MANWLANYANRKSLTIHHTADGAQTNYQMPVYVYRTAETGDDTVALSIFTANRTYVGTTGCLSNYNDIRFTTSDGTTLLPYWIETSSSTYALIWVKFDSIPASGDATFYIYYGYASAAAVTSIYDAALANGAAKLGDHFDDDLSKWTKVGTAGNTANASSIMTIKGDGSSTTNFGAYFTSTVGQATFAVRSYQENDYNSANPSTSNCQNGVLSVVPSAAGAAGGYRQMYENNGAPSSFVTTDNGSNSSASNMTYGAYKTMDLVIRANTNIRWMENGVEVSQSPRTTNAPNSSAMYGFFLVYDNKSTSNRSLCDWIIVMNYTYNQPTWGANGAEEAAPSFIPYANIMPQLLVR